MFLSGNRFIKRTIGLGIVMLSIFCCAISAAPRSGQKPLPQTGTKQKSAVRDTIPPKITLIGDTVVTIVVGDAFEEPGINAIDNIDGDITSRVEFQGEVDPAVPGIYEVVYFVQDKAGNAARQNFRLVVLSKKPVNQSADVENTNSIPTPRAAASDEIARPEQNRPVSLAVVSDAESQKKSLKKLMLKNIMLRSTATLGIGFLAGALVTDLVVIPGQQKKYHNATTVADVNKLHNDLARSNSQRTLCYIVAGVSAVGFMLSFTIPDMISW